METKSTRNRTILAVVSVIALIFAGLFVYNNSSQKNKLAREKIRAEALLSEKLDLDRSMVEFQKQLNSLKGKNANLDKIVAETSAKLAQKELEIKTLIAEKASMNELKKKNAELEALRITMEGEIDALNANYDQLLTEYSALGEQLESMKTNNEFLALKNAMLESMLADNYQIEALKGKNSRPTVAARRANTIVTSFDVPVGFGENLYFKILTPEGMEISSVDNEYASVRVEERDSDLMASLSGGTIAGKTLAKRTELTYKPEEKLTRGLYRINVYDGKQYMGSIQIRLK